MTRKKVKLAFIKNDTERRASYRKRKKGLIKKVSELSTLCGVDACAIIYSEFDAEPEVWPSVEGAKAVLARFMSMSEVDRTRKMVNQESFTRQRIQKVNDQISRLRRDNNHKEVEGVIFSHMVNDNPPTRFVQPGDDAELGFVINLTLFDIQEKMEALKKSENQQADVADQLPPLLLMPPPLVAVPAPEVAPMEMGFEFPAVQEEELPVLNAEDLDGFPWSLVETPAFGGLDDGLPGWDDSMTFSNFFNSINNGGGAGPSGTKPRDDGGGGAGPSGTKLGDYDDDDEEEEEDEDEDGGSMF